MNIYHFLGSVYFAILLIASTTLFVIAGTFIESITQSHRYASQFTYSSPLFIMLLWGFFINILVSALRRWPFKVRHIPFLITHFGLLMILAGVLIKVYFGTQGTMGIMEGAGSHLISKDNTYTVRVEKQGEQPLSLALNNLNNLNHTNRDHSKLQIKLVKYTPNSSEKLTSWIKGNYGIIWGTPPLPLSEYHDLSNVDEIPISRKVRFKDNQSLDWNVYALKVRDLNETLNHLYQQQALIKISDRASGITLATMDLKKALKDTMIFSDKNKHINNATVSLNLFPEQFNELNNIPNLTVESTDKAWKIGVALKGAEALINENLSTPYLGNSPLVVDIIRAPLLALLEDQYNDTYLAAFDSRGQVWLKSFAHHQLNCYLAYDGGYGGYSIQCDFPFPDTLVDREHQEKLKLSYLTAQMQLAVSSKAALSPPLLLLKKACEKANLDFVEIFMAFIIRWDLQHSWLYPEDPNFPEQLEKAFKEINWDNHPKRACYWTLKLFSQLDPSLAGNRNIISILRENQWPLIADCESLWSQHSNDTSTATSDTATAASTATSKVLKLLTQQIFSTDKQLPVDGYKDLSNNGLDNARLLSAYFRAYDIHLSSITPALSEEEIKQLKQQKQSTEQANDLAYSIETPLTTQIEEVPIRKKLEDNIPAVTLLVEKEGVRQLINLTYDRFGSGLKWPILNGSYLLKFQPQFEEIPYHIRLRQARQINYAHSKQAFSYESDIIVTDRRTGESIEKTISMNHVHETPDGYRFYLSNISPSDESAVKHIQVIVNRDPAKHWLTYPGALILSLGIILLFWMKPYKKNKY